jgi:hypothetical protein
MSRSTWIALALLAVLLVAATALVSWRPREAATIARGMAAH